MVELVGIRLDRIRKISLRDFWELRIELWEKQDEDPSFAVYQDFWLSGPKENYQLHVSFFKKGDIGDSLVKMHRRESFKTHDRDNDKSCAKEHTGGWWFKDCLQSNLNGLNLDGYHSKNGKGIQWLSSKPDDFSFSKCEMKIRPMNNGEFSSTSLHLGRPLTVLTKYRQSWSRQSGMLGNVHTKNEDTVGLGKFREQRGVEQGAKDGDRRDGEFSSTSLHLRRPLRVLTKYRQSWSRQSGMLGHVHTKNEDTVGLGKFRERIGVEQGAKDGDRRLTRIHFGSPCEELYNSTRNYSRQGIYGSAENPRLDREATTLRGSYDSKKKSIKLHRKRQVHLKASLIGENHNQETAMNLSSPEFNNKGKWILDSGATSHMSTDINLMDDLQDDSRKITLPDDRFIKSNGIGTVEIYKDDNHLLTLKEVLNVPELNSNLISVSKITEDEKQIIFDENGARIIDNNGSSIITAKRKDNIYAIDACANIKLEENNWKIWHKRLAHINENYMNMVLKGPMVYGFSCSPINNLEPCITCIQSKCTILPFKEIDLKQSTKPLDLIHMDLIGPFQHESIGRAIYVLNIVDDLSRKIFPKFPKSKLETFAKLKEFIELIENIKGTKIKRIRSDNGGEFTNRQFCSYLIEKGIEHQITTFYSPSQNVIVERANRSLIEGTRALLIELQLPPKFWAEAMNTYSYKTTLEVTPHEFLLNEKSNFYY
ncbi:hypothetical protein LAZ67_3004515 [Cordylochernes scorpioides]|uniref:Uncharacterized protein n=1 Tax=Cordylochernes scorpioides TaxID=51811 RepID=A0ABY6KCV9_9ARAC|nr:hypothetical protein LAZ67_3004515 [Cordylochernes scorpioides]